MGNKYSVGYHGPKSDCGIQGIATLTHDPIAIENRQRIGNVKLNQTKDLPKESIADKAAIK